MSSKASAKFPKHFASKFQVYRSGIQIIPSPALTTVNIDTAVYDTINEINLVTNRFTPRETGYYYMHGYATFLGAVPAGTVCSIAFRRNAGTYPINNKVADGVVLTHMHLSYIFYLTVGEWVEMQVAQNSGVNQNMSGGIQWSVFEGVRVG